MTKLAQRPNLRKEKTVSMKQEQKNEPPFGTYKLNPIRDSFRKQAIRWKPKVRLISDILRKITTKSIRGPVDVELFQNMKVRLYPKENRADSHCLKGTFNHKHEAVDIYRTAIKNTKNQTIIFVDIGANSGMHSIIAANLAQNLNKNIQIIAAEPNPILIPRFIFNINSSGLEKNTTLFKCAVSDKNEKLRMYINRQLGESKITNEKQTTKLSEHYNQIVNKVVEVQAKTLDSILKEAKADKIDILKIDVEGHEIKALKPYLENTKKINLPEYIVAETLHDKNNKLKNLIEKYGYEIIEQTHLDTMFKKI